MERVKSHYLFYVSSVGVPLGYVLPFVAEAFGAFPGWTLDNDSSPRTLTLSAGNDEPSRSDILARTLSKMREQKSFKVLSKWRDELKPVYGADGNVLFTMERSATPLLGVVTYGVHMTAYVRDSDDNGKIKIWVSRRAPTKSTYPNLLDNTVSGGVQFGEHPLHSLLREAQEEASLPGDVISSRIHATGTISYFHSRDERAGGETHLLQPEVEYLYDCELPANVVPKPNDGEVSDFRLWSVEEVKEALANGEFKPSYAPVMIDFFVRHGILNADNEDDYVELVSRLHRKLEFPLKREPRL
jgi:isopentenyldiphosphate isomerase